MPARRRDMLTGRLNFLHRSWGPIEPYDNTFPELIRDAGIYTHLVSDHYHYWEDGGATYHNRYSSYEFVRGQERDLWKAIVSPTKDQYCRKYHESLSEVERRFPNIINREHIKEEKDFPMVRCLDKGLEFLDANRQADSWLLQLEFFDPNEPFVVPERFKQHFPTNYNGPIIDWPVYGRNNLKSEEVDEIRANYAALASMCDHYLGKLIDYFDVHNLWDDTALFVTTDHGFMLGEHQFLGKNLMPMFNEIAHIPLIFYHPDYAQKGGEHRKALTQSIDLMSTVLEMFDVTIPTENEGRSLLPVLKKDEKLREAPLYGVFGGATNITDGRYTYFRYPPQEQQSEPELYEYTLMPMHPASLFSREEFEGAELVRDFKFTKGFPLLRLPALNSARRPPMQGGKFKDPNTVLYDLEADPSQSDPISDPQVEGRLIDLMKQIMQRNEAPPEAYKKLGFDEEV